jgi:aerobic C4-dicarboxylate transport protein
MAFAIAGGILLGYFKPSLAMQMKPLGDWFLAAIRLLIVPIVFFTVMTGIGALVQVRQVGRLGVRIFFCFELMSTLALLAGLLAAHFAQPGAGFPLSAEALHGASGIRGAAAIAMPDLPQTVFQAFGKSSILQALLFACICGVATALLGRRAAGFSARCDRIGAQLLKLVQWLMYLAPLAAFGAIAFSVGRYGVHSVTPLIRLLVLLYATTGLFVLVPLGLLARRAGIRIGAFIRYLKEELLLVFGTSSSVTAMPGLLKKLEMAGCPRIVAGVAIPAGYSFNLNGSNIYLAMAVVFLAQAFGIELGPGEYLTILAVAMVTSKGANGVAGSAFMALAATIAAVPALPDSSLLLIVGIERLLKCRPIANVIGNGVACMAIAAWDGRLEKDALDRQRLR